MIKAPISFKKAGVIVIALHVMGFATLYTIGSMNGREMRRALIQRNKEIAENYGKNNEYFRKPVAKVYTYPKPKAKPKPTPKPVDYKKSVVQVGTKAVNMVQVCKEKVNNLGNTVYNDTNDIIEQIQRNTIKTEPIKQPVPKYYIPGNIPNKPVYLRKIQSIPPPQVN